MSQSTPEELAQGEQCQEDVAKFIDDPAHKWARVPLVLHLMAVLIATGAVSGLENAYAAVLNLELFFAELQGE
jgi:hypothetical protein